MRVPFLVCLTEAARLAFVQPPTAFAIPVPHKNHADFPWMIYF
jgi:hypothetical protein